MIRLLPAVLTAFATLAVAAPAGAAAAAHDERPLRNVDVRRADRGPVPAVERRARAALERQLGDEGIVSTDRVSGGVRLVARADGFLTGRRADAPAQIALDYVRTRPEVFGLEAADLDALALTSRYRSPDGVTHLAYIQTYRGIAAYDNVLLANLDEDGRLLNVGGAAVAELRVASIEPDLGAGAALAAAKQEVRGAMIAPRARQAAGAERRTRFSNGDTAELTLFNDGSATRLAWRLQVTGERRFLYEVVVDATNGEVLKRRSLTEFAAAQVYRNFPGAPVGGSPEPVDLAADPTWLNRSQETNPRSLRGNNAWAFADADATDGPSAGDFDVSPSSGSDWNYTIVPFAVPGQTCPPPGCTWNSTDPSTRARNRNQAATQLFYFVNRFHDHLKGAPIGFTHAARGFEFTDADGPSRPGLGGDPVLAESDNYLNPDDSEKPPLPTSTDNASMSTPADGKSPWLQTFLFTNPSLNAADTADVVYHEYTHGLTNRSVGDGSGLFEDQSRALGEGWSDWYALDFLVGDGLVPDTATEGELQIGAYLLPGGFRWQGLDCPVGSPAAGCRGPRATGGGGFTLGDLGKFPTSADNQFPVHDNGEIWGQTLWDLRGALGAQTARALVTGGLRLAPNNPSFLDARDAIILADRALGGANHDTLWRVFAARGMGHSASTASARATTAQEAFDLPPATPAVTPPVNTEPAPAPTPTPTPTPTPRPTPTPIPESARTRAPAKLEVLRAGVQAGRLDVLARMTTLASGRVSVTYRSSGTTTRFTAPVVRGTIRISRVLPASQRRKSTGIFTLAYDGSQTVQPDTVTLRAARGKALLVRRTARIDSRGRLLVSGSISARARGVVRVRLVYAKAGGETAAVTYRAKIANGAWSLASPLPSEARSGGQLSIQFTGYEPRLIRGEQLAKAVAP